MLHNQPGRCNRCGQSHFTGGETKAGQAVISSDLHWNLRDLNLPLLAPVPGLLRPYLASPQKRAHHAFPRGPLSMHPQAGGQSESSETGRGPHSPPSGPPPAAAPRAPWPPGPPASGSCGPGPGSHSEERQASGPGAASKPQPGSTSTWAGGAGSQQKGSRTTALAQAWIVATRKPGPREWDRPQGTERDPQRGDGARHSSPHLLVRGVRGPSPRHLLLPHTGRAPAPPLGQQGGPGRGGQAAGSPPWPAAAASAGRSAAPSPRTAAGPRGGGQSPAWKGGRWAGQCLSAPGPCCHRRTWFGVHLLLTWLGQGP